MTGGESVAATVKFVSMINKFFDCLNVTNFVNGKRSRKPFQDPYRSSSDIWLKVLRLGLV